MQNECLKYLYEKYQNFYYPFIFLLYNQSCDGLWGGFVSLKDDNYECLLLNKRTFKFMLVAYYVVVSVLRAHIRLCKYEAHCGQKCCLGRQHTWF